MEPRGSWWEVSRGKADRAGSGAIIRPADLFSAKPNEGCRGGGWWQGGVGAQGLGPFPGQNWHHSLAARPQRWVVCRGGGAADRGPIPSHQQNLGRNSSRGSRAG